MWHFQFFREKNTSPKWRSRRWLEIAQKLFHHRVGDKILRQKFGIHLSPISNNKGATAPRKLPYGLKSFFKILTFGLVLFSKNFVFCYIPAIFNIWKPRLRKDAPFYFPEILHADPSQKTTEGHYILFLNLSSRFLSISGLVKNFGP